MSVNYLHNGSAASALVSRIRESGGVAIAVQGDIRIRVNAVRPGVIETEIHASGGEPDRARRMAPSLPMRRPGTPEEVASAILWFTSEASSYCTGSILDVAGGR